MAEISVIIPSYKAENYLPRAIRSLQAQSFTNWEAVIVSDDTTNYETIIRQMGLTDERLRFTTTGMVATGVSNARNVGLANASTDYVTYLDADDRLLPSYLQEMLNLLTDHDFVLANHRLVDLSGHPITYPVIHARPSGVITLKEITKVTCSNCCATIAYHRQRVRTQWISGLSMIEDSAFLFQAFDYVDSIYCMQEPLYLYYQNPGSLTHHISTNIRFMESKRMVLDKIRNTHLFMKPELAYFAERYFQESLKAEEDYLAVQKEDLTANFLKIFRRRLIEQKLL